MRLRELNVLSARTKKHPLHSLCFVLHSTDPDHYKTGHFFKKAEKCACECDLEATALFIGGYNKMWILNLELCNTVRNHMQCMLVVKYV